MTEKPGRKTLHPEAINVLLIEDNPGDARLINELLSSSETGVSFQLTWVERLSQGIEHLSEVNFQSVLVDLSLPDSQGLDTLRMVRNARPDLPVVVMTGIDDEETALLAVQEGAQDFLVKGQVDNRLLVRTIRYALERKQAEQALRESEDRYRSLFNSVPVGLYRSTPQGEFLEVNPAAAQMLGYPDRQALLDAGPLELYVNSQDRQDQLASFNHTPDFGEFEIQLKKQDGQQIWVRDIMRSIRDASGKMLHYEGFLEDITVRKQAEERIHRLVQQLTIAGEMGRILAATLDQAEIYPLLAQAIQRLLPDIATIFISEYGPEKKSITAVYGLQDGERVNVAELPVIPLAPPGQGTQSQVIHQRQPLIVADLGERAKKGRFVQVGSPGPDTQSAMYVPMLAQDQVLGLLQVQSYSPSRFNETDAEVLTLVGNTAGVALQNARLFGEAQSELVMRKRAEEALRSTVAEKEILLREVHHRVKNNLQAIIYLIEHRLDQVSDEQSVLILKNLKEQARTIALVYEQLHQSVNLSEVHMKQYLPVVARNVMEAFGANRRVSLNVECEDFSLEIDQAMPCGLMVAELITNSIKYAFPPAYSGSPQIDINLSVQGDQCDLVVRDNGVGLPENPDEPHTKSMGLRLVGLWATHQMGGTLEVEGGSGATYHITFPVKR